MKLALPAHSDGCHLTIKELLNYKNQSVRWLPPARNIWSQLNGQHLSRQKGRGMDFAEVRPYQGGDDIRSIDWRVTARTGKAHTKLFSEERERPVMLLIDFSISMYFGSQLMLKSVQAAHFASLVAWLTVAQKDRIGAVIVNPNQVVECKPTARQQGSLRLLNRIIDGHQQLSEIALQTNDNQNISSNMTSVTFSQGLRHLDRLCPKGSEVVIISDFHGWSVEDELKIAKLRQHNQIQFVHISDPLEQGETEYRGSEYVTDHHHTGWVDFSKSESKKQLAGHFSQHYHALKQLANRLAIPLHGISAGEALLSQLVNGNVGKKRNENSEVIHE
ncbi:DUF58 domain-containing protein [Vibrio sp. SS-MA-C1-2]|uniref:DUF58 domain-containing protein n=1 Tax=Vibrio sp. SS-MA-C1-2 TaxID=2908646 RepID=UPI001F268126|nr:DUF58 domain-containing protein [Vibrio sp. SS-MA-C1-2]UJF18586.1 DUF58 domain-containing protein [Vibrio sp. SS-MA-C1-2]